MPHSLCLAALCPPCGHRSPGRSGRSPDTCSPGRCPAGRRGWPGRCSFQCWGWSSSACRSSSFISWRLEWPDAVLRRVPLLRKAAGALDELQVVILLPGDDMSSSWTQYRGRISSMPGKVVAVELGRHGLKLGAVEQAHERGLHHVAEVVAQGDLVAAQLPGLGCRGSPGASGRRDSRGSSPPWSVTSKISLSKMVTGISSRAAFSSIRRRLAAVIARVHHQKRQLKGRTRCGAAAPASAWPAAWSPCRRRCTRRCGPRARSAHSALPPQ